MSNSFNDKDDKVIDPEKAIGTYIIGVIIASLIVIISSLILLLSSYSISTNKNNFSLSSLSSVMLSLIILTIIFSISLCIYRFVKIELFRFRFFTVMFITIIVMFFNFISNISLFGYSLFYDEDLEKTSRALVVLFTGAMSAATGLSLIYLFYTITKIVNQASEENTLPSVVTDSNILQKISSLESRISSLGLNQSATDEKEKLPKVVYVAGNYVDQDLQGSNIIKQKGNKGGVPVN